MEPTNDQLLCSIGKTLAERVVPNVSDGETARLIQLAVLAVEELRRRESAAGEPAKQRDEKLAALVAEGERLAAKRQLVIKDEPWPPRPGDLMPQSAAGRNRESLWERLSALVATLLETRPLDGECRAFITAVARMEVEDKLRPVSPPVEDAPLPSSRKLEGFASYFAGRLGLGAEAVITEIRQLAGGFSNETFLVTLKSPQASRNLVVRLSQDNGINSPFSLTLEEELPVLQMVASAGVPVPKPLWLETDRSLLGRPFLVVDYVPAKPIGSSLQAAGAISDALVENYARALAKLHATPWQQWVGRLPERIAPSADLTVTDSIDLILARMREYLEASWISPSPVTLILFDWLERNRPMSVAAPVVTHGDLGFHNWLFDGDTPLALLDWETVALCSHTKDLANVRDVVVPPAQWDHFIACYVAAGGHPLVNEELHYYAVLRHIQAVICTSIALEKMFTRVDPLTIDYLELGIGARAYFYQDIFSGLDRLLE